MFETKTFKILKTPKDGLTFLMLTLFIYVTAPIFEWLTLEDLLTSGKLPPNADSIGLEFAFFLFAWILGIPIVLAFIYWILWKYPAQVSLLGFNSQRPFWSYVWTLVFVFLAFDSLALVFVNLAENYFLGALQHLALVYLFLLFRTSIVFRKGEI